MARPRNNRQQISIEAHKLTDIAKCEAIAYRTAQRRKDKFACVLIEAGTKTEKDGSKTQKYLKRYLDSKTTDLLRASGLFTK